MHHAFTITYSGCVDVLTTKVGISLPMTFEEAKANENNIQQYAAIWDTGATHSAITKKVADNLNLKPIRSIETHHAGGASMVNLYMVNITLPIGMDIIGAGDLAVTNFDNKTTISFRTPSVEMIDFVPSARDHNVIEGGNRQQRRALKAKKK